MAADLLGPDPLPAHRLVATRILVGYIELAERDRQAAELPPTTSPAVLECLDKIRNRAERRFLRLGRDAE